MVNDFLSHYNSEHPEERMSLEILKDAKAVIEQKMAEKWPAVVASSSPSSLSVLVAALGPGDAAPVKADEGDDPLANLPEDMSIREWMKHIGKHAE
eukprot:14970981-Heterocapsa_arctica.AAC.1